MRPPSHSAATRAAVPCRKAVRAELGEEAFADLWAQGRAWSIDEAVAYGLEVRAEG